MGVSEEIVADLGATINRDGAVKHGVAPDVSVFVDETVRADVGVFSDARAFGDDGGRMDPRNITRGLVEKLDGVGKCQVGICGAEGGERCKRRVPGQGNAFLD